MQLHVLGLSDSVFISFRLFASAHNTTYGFKMEASFVFLEVKYGGDVPNMNVKLSALSGKAMT